MHSAKHRANMKLAAGSNSRLAVQDSSASCKLSAAGCIIALCGSNEVVKVVRTRYNVLKLSRREGNCLDERV